MLWLSECDIVQVIGLGRRYGYFQLIAGYRRDPHHLLSQAVEQSAPRGRRSAVKAKGELDKIVIQMRRSDRTLVGAQVPPTFTAVPPVGTT